jgi:hypothetical protein
MATKRSTQPASDVESMPDIKDLLTMVVNNMQVITSRLDSLESGIATNQPTTSRKATSKATSKVDTMVSKGIGELPAKYTTNDSPIPFEVFQSDTWVWIYFADVYPNKPADNLRAEMKVKGGKFSGRRSKSTGCKCWYYQNTTYTKPADLFGTFGRYIKVVS